MENILLTDFCDRILQRCKLRVKKYLRPFIDSCVDARRIECRLLRLEILQYYQNEQNHSCLEPDGLEFLRWLENEFFTDCLEHKRLLTGHGGTEAGDAEKYGDLGIYRTESGMYCAKCNGFNLHLSWDEDLARRYWVDLVREQLPESAHCYFDESRGFVFPKNAIVADVGAAEGFLAAKYFPYIEKAYLFEPEEKWIRRLKKTYAGYEDKIVIVPGFVGNGPDSIRLDDFFADKKKPTVVKLDVEGAEAAVLKGASKLLADESLPMHLVTCLYHRKEDEENIVPLVQEFFNLSYSEGYFWYRYARDDASPFFRRGVLRALREK